MTGSRTDHARRIWVAMAWGVGVLTVHSASIGGPTPPTPVAALTSAGAPAAAEEAKASARQLLAARDAEALARLASGLTDDQPAGFRAAIGAVIAESPPVLPELAPALASAIQSATDEELPGLLSAARWSGDRALVGAVVEQLRRESPQLRALAMATLRSQTGDAVVTESPDAWIEWWNRSRSGTDGAWWKMIAGNRGITMRTTVARLTSTEQRLRRLFLEIQPRLSEEERSAFIADLMGATERADQLIGLELAERALLNARSLGPSEVKAAAALLRNPNLEIRSRAAALLDRSDPMSFGDEVRAALRTEVDADVAASLLRLVGRSGGCGAELDVLRWLRQGPGPAYAAAFDSAAALLAAGCFTQQADRDEIARHALSVVMRAGVTQASPSVARICGSLGLTWAVRQLLSSPIEEVARVAAEALVSDPASLDLIVGAARSRPGLFGAASLALAHERPTAEGMATLMTLPAEDDARTAGIATLARAMSCEELVRSLGSIRNAELRIAAAEQGLSAAPDEPACAALRMELADALIEAGRAAAALAVLESPEMPEELAASRRCMVLVWLGRLDDAQAVAGAGVDAWLAGLERSIGRPHAREAARLIEATFGEALTESQRARISEIADPTEPTGP